MSKAEEGLNFVYHEKGDILEQTLGRLLAVPTQHLTQGTYKSIFKYIPEENIDFLAEKFKDVKWQGDVEVHLNHSPFWKQMQRLFEKERPRSLFTRVVAGIPVTLWTTLAGKLFNCSLYNPYADVVQLFNENKYMDLAKLNVAEFIHEKSENNTVWQEFLSIANSVPVLLNTVLFIKTNTEALKKLDEDEYKEGSRYLFANSASEGIIDAMLALAGLSSLQVLDLPANVKEAIDLNAYEKLAVGAGIAGGISLYSELTKNKDLDSSMFFDESISIESEEKKKKKKKETKEGLSPQVQLGKLAA